MLQVFERLDFLSRDCRGFFLRNAIISAWVSNGPCVRPALMSPKASARRASITRRWAEVYSPSAVENLTMLVGKLNHITLGQACPLAHAQ